MVSPVVVCTQCSWSQPSAYTDSRNLWHPPNVSSHPTPPHPIFLFTVISASMPSMDTSDISGCTALLITQVVASSPTCAAVTTVESWSFWRATDYGNGPRLGGQIATSFKGVVKKGWACIGQDIATDLKILRNITLRHPCTELCTTLWWMLIGVQSGLRLNVKTVFLGVAGDFLYKDKTVIRLSYLYNGNSNIWLEIFIFKRAPGARL